MDVESTFQASYERLIGSGVGITDQGRAFFRRFYDNFIESSDVVRAKFENTDMDRQVVMMQKGVYQFMSFYMTKEDTQFLLDMAIAHSPTRHDISHDLYDLWLDALLQTVQEMDPEYNSEVKLAWNIVMAPGVLYMKHHSG